MKKYLLFIISMVCTSIGAWAEATIEHEGWNNAGYSDMTIFQSDGAGSIAAKIPAWNTAYQYNWTNKNYVAIKGEINQADITALATIGLGSNIDYAVIDLSEATIVGDVTYTFASQFAGLRLPVGADLTADYGNTLSYIVSSGLTGSKSWNGASEGSNEIDLHIKKTGGIQKFINTWQAKDNAGLYCVQYRTVNLSGEANTIDTSSQEYTNLTGISGVTVNRITNVPYEIDNCAVTINLAKKGTKTFTEIIAEALAQVKTETGNDAATICTLTIQGEFSSADITALNTEMGTGGNLASIESLNLGGATGMAQTDVDALEIPKNLTRLTIPADRIVDGALKTTLATPTFDGLTYVYSPSSDSQKPGKDQESQFDRTKNLVADYVWVNRQNALPTAFTNEEQLRNSYNIKVASSVELTATDVNFDALGTNKPSNYLFLNFSDANLTPAVAASYTVTDDIGYRIILPNNWTGDQMAVFAANPHCGNLAAVYSYNVTKLNIMEIKDGAYSPAALADPRIVRAGTTEVNVISGTYNGETYANFGDHLLAALNNMGKSEFDYNSSHYNNTVGLTVTKVSIETGSNVPNAITFDNPTIQTLELKNVGQGWSSLDVDACSSLQTLNLNYINLGNVSAKVPAASPKTGLTSINLSGATINGSADFSTSPLTSAFTMDDGTYITSNLLLKSTGLTSFIPKGTIGGDIYLNASNSLASLDVRQFTQAATKKIHIDADATDESGTAVISGLDNGTNKTITVPTGYNSSERFHPYAAISDNINEEAYVPPVYTTSESTLKLHEKETNDQYLYWYDDQVNKGQNITLGTGESQTLKSILENSTNASAIDFTSITYRRAKINGPLTSTDIAYLDDVNCQVLDLSSATFDEDAWTALKNAFKTSGTNIHSNVRFVILPSNSTREEIINGTALAGLTNVLSVIALNKITGATDESDNGTNLTSWNRVPGALQAAVVAAGNHSCQSWTKTPDGETDRSIYTSDISDFRECKISGLINSHDLSKGNQNLDANGHLSWDTEPVELSSGTDPRKLNGNCTAYGPFSASFNLSVIDLKGAFFEEKGDNTGLADKDKRYYFQDMTLSALGIISTGTYKVVVPTDPRAKEIPADFMNCSTNIRAICIPSNIVAIRTRAFYTIDYVWTTATNLTGTVDPEGSNTKLDNGAKLKIKDGTTYSADGTDFIETSALIYDNGAYKENPAFTKKCYVADYGTINGGGTYTFGSNLRLIETGAFANAQPHVKDVYVLNTKAPECHVDAFNTVMYTGNGGYSSISGDQKIISRENYFNNGFWITMLHYPRQTTTPELQRYTDPTREYSIATGERDGKGATLYFPNQSEFIRAYQQGTYGYIWNAWNPAREYGSVFNGTLLSTTSGWTEDNQTTANALFNDYASGANHQYTSFYKVDNFEGKTVTAPTAAITPYYNVYWSDAAYNYSSSATEGYSKLYPQSELSTKYDGTGIDNDNSGEQTSKDYRGWHQFVLNAYAANTVLKEEPYRSYITDDDWWTVCLPFSLTRYEAIQIFGTEAKAATAAVGEEGKPGYVPAQAAVEEKLPYVSRLMYVIRDLNTANISLCFSKNLMEHSEGLGSANDKQHGTAGANGIVTITEGTAPGSDDIVMAAGVPYLIKPAFPLTRESYNRQFQVYNSTDYENLSTAQKNAVSPRAINNTDLYNRIKASKELTGEQQMALIHGGVCKVPVFMPAGRDTRVSEEAGTGEYTIGSGKEKYQKSTKWFYAFVGSFYKSFMPQYAYYLGWNSTLGKAQFFYKTSAKENVMTWTNETGVIIPTKDSEFSATVTPASGFNPAQWLFFDNSNATTLANDAFTIDNGSGATQQSKNYDMLLDAENVNVITAVDMPEVTTEDMLFNGNNALYNINGQKVNSSGRLPKGIYIQNGKKHVVK